MVEIQNPVPLGFRVAEVPWTEEATVYDQGRPPLKAIPLREIFADDLERALWLAIKSRHVTSQYFRHQIREAAASIRAERPTNASDLHSRIQMVTGHHDERDRFCQELLAYVWAVLDGGTQLAYTEPEEAKND
jgi:hypothetical protein